MGMTFQPPANAAQVIFDLKHAAPAPLEETFRAMIAQVLSVGTFHGSLDYDGQFETAYVQNNIQTATHHVSQVTCALQDNIATLTTPQMAPGSLVRKILDPVLADVFQVCPSWTLDQNDGGVWHARLALGNGLTMIVEIRRPLDRPFGESDAARGAISTIEVVPMN